VSVLERIDPEYLPIIRQVPIIDLSDIDAARAALHVVFAMVGTADPHPAIARIDHEVPGLPGNPPVRVREYRPRGALGERPALLWIQGGGYVLTAADPDDQWCEQIAHDLQCVVVSVLWRRAPEHPFPAAHNDCYAALKWMSGQALSLNIDSKRIVVGGASSGGGAAAAVSLHARDEGLPIAHQLLIYPMLDDRNVTRSSRAVTDRELWCRDSNERAWRAYLGADFGTDRVSPYAAPTRAGSLAGLSPATILTGELDLFVDENLDYAQRLIAEGIRTELHMYPAVHHGFDRHNPQGRQARRMLADRDAALRAAFGIN
jgi:acetyl esterase/lipase